LSTYKKEIEDLHAKFSEKLDSTEGMTFDTLTQLHQEFKKKAESIINKFLVSQAPKEINVAGATKKLIIQTLDNITKEYNTLAQTEEMSSNTTVQVKPSVLYMKHYNIFGNLENVIKGQLQYDVFPRFIRSDIWKSFILQQDKTFLEQVSTKRQQGDIIRTLYTYDDYMNPVITDLDFDLVRMLSQDGPEWKLIYTHNKTGSVELSSSCYIMMDYNFIVGQTLPSLMKNRPFTKIVCYFPYDAPDCYETLKSVEHCYKAEKILEEVKFVDYLSPDITAGRKYATGYEHFRYKLANPKLVNYRVFPLLFSDIIDPKDTSVIMGFARDTKLTSDLPPSHTLGSIYASFQFKQVGEKLTRLTQITSMNMGGFMKGFNNAFYRQFLKNMFITRCKNLRDDMMAGLEERERSGWKAISPESLLRIQDLKENTITHSAIYGDDDNEYSLIDYAKNIPVDIPKNKK
jgi:hypothetical protein